MTSFVWETDHFLSICYVFCFFFTTAHCLQHICSIIYHCIKELLTRKFLCFVTFIKNCIFVSCVFCHPSNGKSRNLYGGPLENPTHYYYISKELSHIKWTLNGMSGGDRKQVISCNDMSICYLGTFYLKKKVKYY